MTGELYDVFGELCRIEAVGKDDRGEERVSLAVLAGSRFSTGSLRYRLYSSTLRCTGIRQVGPEDLVLYLGKEYKSDRYLKLLKGD